MAVREALGLLNTPTAPPAPDRPEAWLEIAEPSIFMYADRDTYGATPIRYPCRATACSTPPTHRPVPLIVRDRLRQPPAGQPAVAPLLVLGRHRRSPGFHLARRHRQATSTVCLEDPPLSEHVGERMGLRFSSSTLSSRIFLQPPRRIRPAERQRPAPLGKRPRSSMSPMIILDGRGTSSPPVGSPAATRSRPSAQTIVAGHATGICPCKDPRPCPTLIARRRFKFNSCPNSFGGHGVSTPWAAKGRGGTPSSPRRLGIHGHHPCATADNEGGADPRRDGVRNWLTERLRRSLASFADPF